MYLWESKAWNEIKKEEDEKNYSNACSINLLNRVLMMPFNGMKNWERKNEECSMLRDNNYSFYFCLKTFHLM